MRKLSSHAAILFPVFAKAREKAKQSACMSNTKQLSLAFTMYAGDYDDWTCPHAMYMYPSGNYYCWEALLQPYIKNTGVFRCPSTSFEATDAIIQQNWSTLGVYGHNINLFNYVDTGGGLWAPAYFPVTMSDLDMPSDTVVMVDTATHDYACLPDGYWWAYGQPAYRHNEWANVAWADGHAKGIKEQQLMATAPNSDGRKVAYLKSAGPQMAWTDDPSVTIYPLWQAAASLPHL